MQYFGHDPPGHACLGILAPEADGAAVLRTAATAAALDGVLHRDGYRAQHVHLLAVVVEAHALDTAVDDARDVRNSDGSFRDVRGEDDARAFGDFEDAVLRFAVLPAVEFQEFGAVVAERFGGGAVAAGDFGLARQEYQRGLPNVVAVERPESPHHFGVNAYARNERIARGRGLVDNLYGKQRVTEL